MLSGKLQIVYGIKMSKTAYLDNFTIQIFACIACVVGGYSKGRVGEGG